MKKEELDNFTNICMNEIKDKIENAKKEYGIGSFDRYHIDNKKAIIEFSKGSDKIKFSVIPIGSWSEISNSWFWAWANEQTYDKELRKKSAKIKELTKYTGLSIFNKKMLEAPSQEYIEPLVAMSIHHLNALTIYKINYEEQKLVGYYAIMEGIN